MYSVYADNQKLDIKFKLNSIPKIHIIKRLFDSIVHVYMRLLIERFRKKYSYILSLIDNSNTLVEENK